MELEYLKVWYLWKVLKLIPCVYQRTTIFVFRVKIYKMISHCSRLQATTLFLFPLCFTMLLICYRISGALKKEEKDGRSETYLYWILSEVTSGCLFN